MTHDTKATARWKVEKFEDTTLDGVRIINEKGHEIIDYAGCGTHQSTFEESTANKIVHAVNCHDELVEALEQIKTLADRLNRGKSVTNLEDQLISITSEALRNARGEA